MSYAQSSKFQFWNLKYIKGAVTFSSDYFYQNVSSLRIKNKLNSTLYRGIIELQSEAFIFHPNFILFTSELSYRPGTRSDEYIVSPTRTQNTSSEKFSTTVYIFKQRPYNGSFYFNFDHTFVNRDFSSNSETFSSNAGFIVNLRNSFLPVHIKYDYENWKQKELFYDREFFNENSNLNLTTNKILFGILKNKAGINYSSFERKYSISNITTTSKNLDFNLTTSASIDAPLKVNFTSFIWALRRMGFDASSRIQVYESLLFNLPYNVKVYTNLQHNSSQYIQLTSTQNSFSLGINHKLYESLFSSAELSFTDTKQNEATEKIPKAEVGFNYTKKIPAGRFNLSYHYTREYKTKNSPQALLIVKDEVHILNDADIVLLDNPNVQLTSIVVKSNDGTIVYREGFDYYIIDRGEFLELRRVLGGQISEGESVLVDYVTIREPSFSYTSHQQNISTSVILFNNLLELRYAHTDFAFTDTYNTKDLALRNISRNIYGIKLNYGDISLGYEKDNYGSNIIPYISDRYFIEFGYFEEGKTLASFSLNYRDYYLKEDDLRQKFFDAVSRISYMIGFYSKISIEGSYRLQEGLGIDLKLGTGKIEYLTRYRTTDLIIGAEFFHREYITEMNDYFNGFLKIRRNF